MGAQGKRPQAGAVQRACYLPRGQDTNGQKGEEGVGGMPCILLCNLYAEGGTWRIGTGGQKARDPEAREEGQGRTR